MKLFTIFISLFTSLLNFNTEKEHEITCINQELVEVEDNLNTIDEYMVKYDQDIVTVYYKSKKIIGFENYSFKYFLINNNLYVFYKESFYGSLKMIKLENGKININKDINNELYASFDITFNYKTFYIVSSIKEYTNETINNAYQKMKLSGVNCILFSVDLNLDIKDVKIFGGELNDYFSTITYNGSTLYVTGHKDTLSGGTFGNGGGSKQGYFLATFSPSLDLEKYVIFDKEIISLDILDKKSYVFLEDYMYLFDDALSLKSSLKIGSGCVFGKMMNNFTTVVITRKELKMFDYNSGLLVSSYEFPFDEDLLEYFIIDDSLYFKTQYNYMRLLIFDQGIINNAFIYDEGEKKIENFNVEGLFKTYEAKGIMDSEFNPSVFGNYSIIVNYGEFDLPITITVLERHNVTSGKVYPTGYNLLFSGVGYLNGEEILNNYQINKAGNYELKLVGKDETKVINFEVKSMDIDFREEGIKNWDFEMYPGEECEVYLDVNFSDEFELTNVYINGSSVPFTLEDNKIRLIFKEYSKGIHKYSLDYFVFENKETKEKYTKDINKILKIKVLNEKIVMDNTISETNDAIDYAIKVKNNKENIRYLKLMIDKNNEEVNYITLIDQTVYLNFINTNKQETINCYIVYDVGKSYYEEEFLFSFDYEFNKTNKIGLLELQINDNNVEEIHLKLDNKKYLKNLIVDNNEVYHYESKDNLKTIIYALIVLVIFVTILMIKIKLKRKRN